MAFNSPDISSLLSTKDKLEEMVNQLQEIGLSGPKDVAKSIWNNMIKPKLLSPRQVAKKLLLMQGQAFNPPLEEEDAQLIVYGKVYYKDGKLFDNDLVDPACVAKPGDDDFQPPLDKNHPMWKDTEEKIKKLKDDLIQFGIKLSEFLASLPEMIITIALSLVSLVSSMIVLPFGAGIPTALTTVQTMMQTIKELQSKTAAFLPYLDIVQLISLLLPKEGQIILTPINIIFQLLTGIIGILTTILGLLGSVTELFSKTKKASDEQELKVETKCEPESIPRGGTSKLTAIATGGDWNYTYQWIDTSGSVISSSAEASVSPRITTEFKCKTTDGKGTISESSTKVTVVLTPAELLAEGLSVVNDIVTDIIS